MNLIGRTALITGASKRLGGAMATRLAEEGVNIILHYRASDDAARSLRDELVKKGSRVTLLKADFSSETGINFTIDFCRGYGANIDILINSASELGGNAGPEGDSTRTLGAIMQVNAFAPYILATGLVRAGLKKVINVTDAYAWPQRRKGYGYFLSKDLLTRITYALALDLAPGVTVNAVAPGPILPPEGRDYEYLDRVAGTVPLGVRGDPGDVVNAMIFLLASDYITGQVIYVDGGAHLLGEGGLSR